jgi:hypothetical protein
MNRVSNAEVLIKAFGFRLASGENSQYRSLRSRIFAPLAGVFGLDCVLMCCFSV